MKPLFLVTSIINIPNTPLSYTPTRSVFTTEERFEQTKKTIESIREKIPNTYVFLIEYSDLPKEYSEYLKEHCDYFYNLYDEDKSLSDKIFGLSKSLGEGTMTLKAIEKMNEIGILNEYDTFFKISGRYFLSDQFNLSNFENDDICIRIIHNINNITTCLYKLPIKYVIILYYFLLHPLSQKRMHECVGYEQIFGDFIIFLNQPIKNLEIIGIDGYISVEKNSSGVYC